MAIGKCSESSSDGDLKSALLRTTPNVQIDDIKAWMTPEGELVAEISPESPYVRTHWEMDPDGYRVLVVSATCPINVCLCQISFPAYSGEFLRRRLTVSG
jgi:hypothetical protein